MAQIYEVQIYEVSTISLIDLTKLRWYVEASSLDEAILKGHNLAHQNAIADEGAISVSLYNGNDNIELDRVYEDYEGGYYFE